MKKYIAEFIGTFALSFIVLVSILKGGMILSVPVIASLTLGLFVYTIGSISGCHINPAVTLGLWSVKKIATKEAISYIIAQFIGAFFAIIIAKSFNLVNYSSTMPWSMQMFFAEMLGMLFFAFGIASVVYGKVKDEISGWVIGGSLLFGILVSVLAGAGGILNPAVALALNSLTAVYLFAPIAGSVVGFHLYKILSKD